MSRFLLIDGNNFLYAAQHSGAKLTSGDIEVSAIFGFLGSLRNVMERFPGSVPIVLWDSTPSWRVDIYPEYKAHRKLNPKLAAISEALRPQRPIIKDLLRDMGVRQYTVHKAEADDLAADLSRKITAGGHDVVLVTRDGDWLQLVNEKAIWYDHKNNKTVNLQNFQEHTGYIDPERFVMGKIIQGDAGDNVPGVGGLGEGTAALICGDFAHLRECYAKWDDFVKTIPKGSAWARNKWRVEKAWEDPKLWDRFDMNQRLVSLQTVTYPQDLYQHDSRYNEEAVHATLRKLGFHSILRRWTQWFAPIQKGVVNG